ncbi:MAG: helix-turn-helix domain-containing protein [Bacteroidales bacterium]|nr:helix-turn-helix domain-containing protein [Bacteroidales bacterium]MCM1205423.1 helix-turn-helix domain-containing protein [Bacillota bacterium]
MKHLIRNILAVLLLSLNAVAAMAQPHCKVRIFGTEDGLPAGVISGLVHSTDNLAWMISWNGLSCYDGYQFTTFRNVPGKTVLPTNHLTHIAHGQKGNLWTVAYTGRVYLFDSRICEYIDVSAIIAADDEAKMANSVRKPFELRKVYPLSNGHTWFVGKGTEHYRVTDSLLSDRKGIERFSFPGKLHKVCLDEKGREWCLTDEGTYCDGKRVSEDSYDYVFVMNGKTWLEPRRGRHVNSCISLDKNRIAMGTDAGVVVIDTRNGSERRFSVQGSGNIPASVREIFADSKHRLWCFTDAPGVTLLDIDSPDTPAQWLNANLQEVADETHSDKPLFHEDSSGTVWVVPTDGTFSYFDEREKSLVPYLLRPINGFRNAIPRIRRYYGDHQGNLWILCPHNLALVNFIYTNVSLNYRNDNRETRAVLQDMSGAVLTGTIDGSLYGADFPFRAKNGIYSLYRDRKNRLWIGTKGDGLYVHMPDGTVHHYMYDAADRYSLSCNNVYDVREDTRGRILVASFDGGLNIIDESMKGKDGKPAVRFINANNELKGWDLSIYKKVRRIDVTPEGVVLLSTTAGLVTFSDRFRSYRGIRFFTSGHRTGDRTSLLSSDVMQTCRMKDGRIYVATLGGGCQLLVSGNLLADGLKFKDLENHGEYTVQGLVRDNADNLWLVSDSRIFRLDKKGNVREYSTDELGEVNITEALPSHNTVTDRIILAIEGGTLSFLPQQMEGSNYRPSIVFTAIDYHDNDGMKPLLNIGSLEVSVDKRTLTVYFSALDYKENSGIRYAYRLDDGNWTYVRRGSNSASFTNFPAGNHRLYVRSTNSDGVWMDNMKSIDIYAEPTFFESWWGRTLCALCLLFCIIYGMVYYMRRQKVQIQEEAVEQADAGKVRFLLKTPEFIDENKVFMDKLLAYIEENISDSDLRVNDMASELKMSRTVFYERIKEIADMSPADFLRHVRMQRAEDLIKGTREPFSQIAYKVGFSDPKYFGKCFKKHTGMSPSEFRKTAKEG